MCDIIRVVEGAAPYPEDVCSHESIGTIRAAEREFAKALRDENMRLKRQIAERDAADAVYFADIEVRKGEVVFLGCR